MSDLIRIRDPRLESAVQAHRAYPTLETLSGKTMVVLNNHWTSMDEIVAYMAGVMKERYGVADVQEFAVPTAVAADAAIIHQAAKVGDFALVGLAN